MKVPAQLAKLCLFTCACAVPLLSRAQTADPTATQGAGPTTAPAAKVGTYAVAQGGIVAAPGLKVPNGNLPWALDTVGDKPTLVPIHHSAITESADADTSAAEMHHVLDGAHARTTLRGLQPVFFVHTSDRTENTGDAGRGNPTGWALLSAVSADGKRTVPHVRFAQISQAAACAPPVLCVQAESLPDGWLRLSPKEALSPGDYALMPVPRQPKPGVVVVYDFQVDPSAPVAKDAIQPGQPAPKRHKS